MSTAQERVGDLPLATGPLGEKPEITGHHPLLRTGGIFAAVLLVTLLLAAVHLTQGTADLSIADVVRAVLGLDGESQAAAVLVASRLPRLLAGILVGAALGAAGAALQSVARNPLASPDTLAVNAGGYLTVVLAAVLGITVPFYLSGLLAFAGGLTAAGLVLALARGGGSGPTRLILAGSATTLALSALTSVLLVIFEQETLGLFVWGSGSVVQSGTRTVALAAPVVVAGLLGLAVLAHRLDLLALGDDAARVLGVDVRTTRVLTVGVAVLLAAAAVTVAGPIGFVGLCAPVLARLVARTVPGLSRHTTLLPLAALTGVVVVLGADVLLRIVLPGQLSAAVPTGIVTTVFGAATLVILARRMRDSGPAAGGSTAHVRPRTVRRAVVVASTLVVLLVGAVVAALLLGDRLLLLGDVANWAGGQAGRQVGFVLDQRVPRVLAALLAGAGLGLAGTMVQAVCRNPLAEPSLLGVTAGAGLGAVCVILLVPGAPVWILSAASTAGAFVTFTIVYLLAHRGGLSSDRLVLIGVGMSAGAAALTTLVIVVAAPWNVNAALTWLSGSTYGRTLSHVLPVLIALVVVTPLALVHRREMDVLSLDEDTPRALGVDVERTRLLLLAGTVVVTAGAVCAVGVVGFVGLVAPHAARALVGSRSARTLPVAMLLGALLVSVADTLGRTVIAPAQIPAGLTTALIGAPYFVWLLWRQRSSR
ncbi:iron ABC transporter permease [Sanguibacter suaedae]|uniref:Iron ABC transporter permease n=1 Tax=Sanguibacter suaedae TaxID=2795737 RepID=A0A934M6M9_9MICO|nr:iron ABC transporter permease [Sanguibacter suaedae]MBI9114432.1 iron ABC transporter permease [Sanguibacter suaedae]